MRSGSSPLTRGKRLAIVQRHFRRRLIPAHAGKTQRRFLRRRSPGAHPRSCGENVSWLVGCPRFAGSSLLMRGKLPVLRGELSCAWLIPTHTGKTRACRAEPTSTRAHPRSRGENRYTATYQVTAKGSSPLTRGKRASRNVLESGEGLIPAHAGKTSDRMRAS